VAEQQRNPGSDPFSSWREWLNESERQWNSFLNGVMGTDQFGQFLGQFTNLFMQMQKNIGESVEKYLTSLNLPKRTDVLDLGRRLAAIEERLAAIETATVRPSENGAAREAADFVSRPPRTKKPTGEKS
jgi:polyhydroxyalkanoic acid synthase PhaR subunit